MGLFPWKFESSRAHIKIKSFFLLYLFKLLNVAKTMKKIKSTFSIKNLENISGIKAHTLRIWEKRYNLLEPERTDTNIRRYSLESLKTLLNVTLLYNHGFKISKIASLSSDEIIMMKYFSITTLNMFLWTFLCP